ncbi:DUF3971 domain-containing protein [Acidithiobacillus thiooxidans]|uniref:YhdP family phospholipid transporter n=1 Tax=Acidithiobacillus thiooxidans TaxID=930 RepID=UPI000262526D|nr:AsmA-like C-terminal domain-containing protein [Acidithiobacillus thiooxidans]MBU2810690.1 DUF3971 domain-containing protein [Acidithiobacillus thiooxidans]
MADAHADAPHQAGLRQSLRSLAVGFARVSAVLVAGAMLLILAAYLLFIYRPELLRDYLRNALVEHFSEPVQLSAIRTGWKGGPTVQFQRLLIGSAAHPDLSLNDVDLRFFALPLFAGDLLVRELDVASGSVKLLKNAQGQWHLAGLKSGQANGHFNLKLDPARLQIQHFLIELPDNQHSTDLHLQWLSTGGLRPDMQIHLDWAKGGSLEYAGAAGHGQWALHGLPLAWLHELDGRFPALQGVLSAKGSLVWQDGLSSALDGHFQWQHPGFSGPKATGVQGQLRWRGFAHSGQLEISPISGISAQPLSARLRLHWQGRLQGDFSAKRLPVQLVMDIAGPLLPAHWQNWRQSSWHGNLRDLQVHFAKIRNSQKLGRQLQTRLDDLDIPALGQAPGLDGLSGHLDFQPQQFSLHLQSRQLKVFWPRYFAHSWFLQKVSGHISGRWNAQHWSLQAAPLLVHGPGDLQLTASIGPQQLHLQARLQHLLVRDINTFLPNQGISPALQRWLSRAFLSGTLDKADLRWRGPWQHLPQNRNHDHLNLQAHFHNVHLHYAARWPDAEHLDARLQWTGNALTVRSHGDISGIPVREAQVSIGNLDTALASPLYAEIHTPLPMAKLLPCLRQTPILRHGQTPPLQLSGEGQLHLALKVPFHHEKTQVQGVLALQKAGVKMGNWRAESISGPIHFQRDAINAKNLQGQFVGGPAEVSLQAKALDQQTHLQMQLQGSLQAGQLPLPQSWQSRLHGVIPYQVSGTLENGRLRLLGSARLQRSRSSLPAPFNWSYADEIPVSISGQGLWDRAFDLTVHAAQGQARLSWKSEGRHWQWRAAALRLGAGPLPKMPGYGVRIDGQGQVLPVDEWFALLPEGGPGGSLPTTRFDLHWQQVQLLGQVWQHTRMQGEARGRNWHLRWRSPQSAGKLTYQAARIPAQAAAIHLNVQKLVLSPAQTEPLQSARRASGMTSSPAWASGGPLDLDAHMDHLDWRGHLAHDVSLQAERSPSGWQLLALKGEWLGSHWDLSGAWLPHDGGMTTVQGTVQSHNIGPALEALGMNSLEYGQARYTGKISWPGAPWNWNVQHLQGTIQSHIKNGRLKKMGTDVSWLVYVNPTTLLKDLLTLDYRPLFGEGLFFHALSAKFVLGKGLARSQDIRLNSSALAMHGAGTLDMVDQQMNLNLQVYPLQSFDWLLGGFPLLGPALFGHSGKVLELNYLAQGSWEHPMVTRISSSSAKDK